MRINPVIVGLMFADLFVQTGFGLIDPILAIYINDNITGGSIAAAGIASMLFLVTKSIVQLPFSRIIDRDNDHSDIWWLIAGSLIVTSVPILYIFADHIYLLYIAQIILGIGSGLTYPAWLGLWTNHLDRKKESFEWSLYSTLISAGTAMAAVIGGLVAEVAGFRATFFLLTVMTALSCVVLIMLRLKLKNKSSGRTKRR